jgi:RNA polymerase sigma-70 factor, ECF subfamily
MHDPISLNEHSAEQLPNTNQERAEPDFLMESLMAAYQRADYRAANLLVELLSPRLLRFFAGPMGNSSDAEDMLQDAWLRIHRARHTYRYGEPLLPWIYAIARRVRVDNFRKQKNITKREIAMAVLPENDGQQSTVHVDSLFENMITSLPDRQRQVISLLKVDGYTIAQIASVTSSTAGAVKQRARRGYENLRKILLTEAVRTDVLTPPVGRIEKKRKALTISSK